MKSDHGQVENISDLSARYEALDMLNKANIAIDRYILNALQHTNDPVILADTLIEIFSVSGIFEKNRLNYLGYLLVNIPNTQDSLERTIALLKMMKNGLLMNQENLIERYILCAIGASQEPKSLADILVHLNKSNVKITSEILSMIKNCENLKQLSDGLDYLKEKNIKITQENATLLIQHKNPENCAKAMAAHDAYYENKTETSRILCGLFSPAITSHKTSLVLNAIKQYIMQTDRAGKIPFEITSIIPGDRLQRVLKTHGLLTDTKHLDATQFMTAKDLNNARTRKLSSISLGIIR